MNTLAWFNNPVMLIGIVVLVLLLFGGQKIPEMMKGLGSGVKEFKKGMSDTDDDELRKDKEARAKAEEELEKEVRTRVENEMRTEREKRGNLN